MSENSSCVRCGHIAKKNTRYCVECGAPLINQCTNNGGLLGEACGHKNPSDASFCSKCGAYTTFHKAGLLHTAYNPNQSLEEDEMEEFKLFNNRFFTE